MKYGYRYLDVRMLVDPGLEYMNSQMKSDGIHTRIPSSLPGRAVLLEIDHHCHDSESPQVTGALDVFVPQCHPPHAYTT